MISFDQHPLIAIWEVTRACDLACKHCRADACTQRDPQELSTEEGKQLLDSFAAGGTPLIVLTGGDPAKREDLVDLVAHGHSRGMFMGLTPSATPLVDRKLIQELGRAGLGRLAVSIDAPTAAEHDGFRGVDGSFESALAILRYGRECGISTQINTSVHTGSIDRLPDMVPFVREQNCKLWSVFFVVPTGRATRSMSIQPARVERALEFLADVSRVESFGIKTTAAPHYRRVLLQRHRTRAHGLHAMSTLRVNEGRGFFFVSHVGDVSPSGFLPLVADNVRKRDALDIYRTHPLFVGLRNPDTLQGKCGVCSYRNICGGSRARAYSLHGNPFAADPACDYTPPGYVPHESERVQRHLEVLA